jgi:2,4-dienoyl-CoA reductase-like NADH-dependent reductase (Old Yellow Enzyme family)
MYETLLSPLDLGPLALRNRVLLSGMTTGFGFERGAPDADAIAYFRVRSDGPAVVVVGFGAVAPGGRVEERLPWMWRDDAAAVMAPLAAAIREGGAHPGLQPGHGGRQASRRLTGERPVAPSPVPPRAHVRETPHALTLGEIEDVIAAYARAARAAAEAGFALLEVHAGHGYLIGQFLSPDSNLRDDGYGGEDAAGRARFGAEVVAAVRAAAPGACVTVRMNGADHVPGGLSLDDAVAVAPRFGRRGPTAWWCPAASTARSPTPSRCSTTRRASSSTPPPGCGGRWGSRSSAWDGSCGPRPPRPRWRAATATRWPWAAP